MKVAGDIYIRSLLTDLQSAESEGAELQKEFDWILSLPPSAFASQEMLDWLKLTDLSSDCSGGETDSELGLEPGSPAHRGAVLLPDQVQ